MWGGAEARWDKAGRQAGKHTGEVHTEHFVHTQNTEKPGRQAGSIKPTCMSLPSRMADTQQAMP